MGHVTFDFNHDLKHQTCVIPPSGLVDVSQSFRRAQCVTDFTDPCEGGWNGTFMEPAPRNKGNFILVSGVGNKGKISRGIKHYGCAGQIGGVLAQ